ncbi:ras GEF [Rozella allomycis CSF55]|uniref:Ras GEF n=1 Tax=Rozella allomycis (strain CSF55) TaxID=988480 RepID=A0A4P9YLE2_ROZAC|nr:ras GEF [Rozella allomycis CSF55]
MSFSISGDENSTTFSSKYYQKISSPEKHIASKSSSSLSSQLTSDDFSSNSVVKNSKNASSVNIDIIDDHASDILQVDPQHFAEQMALMDCKLFVRIGIDEFQSVSWTNPNEKHKKAPNIVMMTQRFNQVLDSITFLVEINDYNSLKCVLSALESTPIYRLQKTWAMIPRKDQVLYERLLEIMSMKDNNKAYRERLLNTKPPCIPYLGLYLSDITYLIETIKKVSQSNANENGNVDEKKQRVKYVNA